MEKIRNIITYLQDMDDIGELAFPPKWACHQLGGNRKGAWSLAVSRNWRITFELGGDGKTILNLDCEDYH